MLEKTFSLNKLALRIRKKPAIFTSEITQIMLDSTDSFLSLSQSKFIRRVLSVNIFAL